MLSKENILY